VLSNLNERFRSELKRLNTLLVINIVVSAIGMGISISYGAIRLLAIRLPITVDSAAQFPIIALGIAGFVISIKWLISTVEIFSELQDIVGDCEASKEVPDGDSMTLMIVDVISYYRGKRSEILRMAWVSRIAGVCFFSLAIYGLSASLFGFGEANMMLAVASFLLNLTIGVVALYVPRSFYNLSKSWDAMLKGSEYAEGILKRLLEGKA